MSLIASALLLFSAIALALALFLRLDASVLAGALKRLLPLKMRQPRQKSRFVSVRSAALELELDRQTGRLQGLVLAGTYDGVSLQKMQLDQLRRLQKELGGAPNSLRLLEAYLDGRFPAWRENSQARGHGRQRGSPRPRSMSKQEAYQVLGLESGAGATDVREAHRRLLQRLNPSILGAARLAARINEAKNVLLSNHD